MLRLLLASLIAAVAVAAEGPQVATTAPKVVVEITTSKGVIRCALFADEAPKTVANFLALAEGTKAWKDPATSQEVQKPLYDGLLFHRVIAGFMIQGGDPLGTGAGGPGFQFADEINAASLGLGEQYVLIGDNLGMADFNPLCQYQAQQFADRYLIPRLKERGLGPQTPPAQLEAAAKAMVPELKKITLRRFYEDLGYRYDDTLPPSHRPVRGALAMANSGPNTNGSQFFINVVDTPHLTGKHTVFGEVVAGMEVVDAIAAVPVDAQAKPIEPVVIQRIRRVEAAAAKEPAK